MPVLLRPPSGGSAASLTSLVWRTTPHTFAYRASKGLWVPWPHLAYIGRAIARTVARKNGRLIISLPPRFGKSEEGSHWTPAWYLDQNPNKSVIAASHTQELAAEWGRKVRNTMERNPLITTTTRDDSTAAHRWHTPEGGGMYSVGVGGAVVGRGFDLGLIDDPYPNWETAQSFVGRRRVQQWFNADFYTRREPGATIIVIMHRMHERDLVGYLLEEHEEDWEYISLPHLAEPGDPLGRAVGETLCPERFSQKESEATLRGTSKVVWDSMHQQKPGGGLDERAFERYSPLNLNKSFELDDYRLPLCTGWDFNRNPGMHVELFQYDPRIDRFRFRHEIHEAYMKLGGTPDYPGAIGAVVEKIRSLAAVVGKRFPWPMLEVYGDATGVNETAETTVTMYRRIVNAFRAEGWPVKLVIPSTNPPILSSMDSANESLCDRSGERHTEIHPDCERLLVDMKEQKTDEEGKPDKENQQLGHSGDIFRYATHRLRPVKRERPPVKAGARRRPRVTGVA